MEQITEPSMMGLVVAAVIFVMVFVVSLQAFAHMGFEGAPRKALGICIGLLSGIGIAQLSSSPAARKALAPDSGLYEFILLPYTTLGLCILIGLLLLALHKCWEFLRGERESARQWPMIEEKRERWAERKAPSQDRREWRGREGR